MRKVLYPLAIYAVTALLLMPVFWMIATSLKPAGEYVSTSVSILPKDITFAQYTGLLDNGDVLGKLANSLIVTLGAAVLSLMLGLPAAYVASVFGLMRDRLQDGRNQRTLAFFDWSLVEGRRAAEQLGYVPLPVTVIGTVREALAARAGAAQ